VISTARGSRARPIDLEDELWKLEAELRKISLLLSSSLCQARTEPRHSSTGRSPPLCGPGFDAFASLRHNIPLLHQPVSSQPKAKSKAKRNYVSYHFSSQIYLAYKEKIKPPTLTHSQKKTQH
jgi:hypothetical protein